MTSFADSERVRREVQQRYGQAAGSTDARSAAALARAVGLHGRVIGVDMTPEMIAKGRENAAKLGLANVEFRAESINRLPVEDASVDVVLSNCVINLSPDKPRVFAEAHRVLRPGGRLMISDLVSREELPASVRESVAGEKPAAALLGVGASGCGCALTDPAASGIVGDLVNSVPPDDLAYSNTVSELPRPRLRPLEGIRILRRIHLARSFDLFFLTCATSMRRSLHSKVTRARVRVASWTSHPSKGKYVPMRCRDRASRRSSSVASFLVALASLGLALAGSPHASWASGTPNVVFLVQDCAASGHTLGQDCFQDLDTLQTYLWAPQTGVNPTASTPMAVEIGPGTFTGSLSCPSNGGYVSFRGVGREQTVLHQTNPADQTVLVQDCTQLNFQDLTIQAPPSGGPNGYDASVFWNGCGSSTWTNVDLLVRGSTAPTTSPWWEAPGSGGPGQCKAVHYWFGSRLLNEGDGTASFGTYILSGQHFFYGGEIRYQGSAATPSPAGATAVYVAENGDLRIYGALVRTSVGTATGVDFNSGGGSVLGLRLDGAWIHSGGTFHMHGGMIAADASASQLPINPIGLVSIEGAYSHVLDTSFNILPGPGGTATRALNQLPPPTNNPEPGTLLSAFQWPAGPNPPAIQSVTGSDTFVETDCSDKGDCDNGGNQTHLMIYNTAACPNSKWFDTSTRRCRNDTVGGGT